MDLSSWSVHQDVTSQHLPLNVAYKGIVLLVNSILLVLPVA